MEAVGGFFIFAVGLVFLAGMMNLIKNSATSGALDRNTAIGIKTKVTKSSDAAWKAGHLAAGPWLTAAAWTGYFAGAATAVIALVLMLSGDGSAVALVVPISGTVAVLALLLVGTRKANQAGQEANESK